MSAKERKSLKVFLMVLAVWYLALALSYWKGRAESMVDPQGIPGLLFGKPKERSHDKGK